MILLQNIELPLETDFSDLRRVAAARLGLPVQAVGQTRLYRRAVDARRKDRIRFVCSILAEASGAEEDVCARLPDARPFYPVRYTWPQAARSSRRPVVVGMGPAGLFAALVLARAGLEPVLLERGRPVGQRVRDVERFFRSAALDPDSNICFGEGGAGTFSDGKLNSGIKDPRCRAVLETFTALGGGEELLYEAKPHVGTDRLRRIVENLRAEIIKNGGEVCFEHRLLRLKTKDGRLTGLVAQTPTGPVTLNCTQMVLAVGHAARDTFEMLAVSGVDLEAKPFSVGARIEHSQEWLNRAQYGKWAGHPALGVADYRLAAHLPNGRGVYTFCMCPGGSVVCASSAQGEIVTNGMSLHARNGENANSALLVGVTPADFGSGPLDGVRFQQEIERRAFAAAKRFAAPVQRVGDFLENRPSAALGSVKPTFLPGVFPAEMECCLPSFVTEAMRGGLEAFARKLPGFAAADAVLTGPETRSSSPVRIVRDASGQARLRGLFPAGEGAGYAGGILSAAVDGMRAAESLLHCGA